ncbi:DUF5916 domain-containing protein [uncultured Draconibacterium sp.]|uniref:carbohydrate binding family 9 domain-containing protein n=1 Tax=uncultured Draconibacterium sp. TaxID=1573823 RepID=UPI0025F3A0D3|nr:DUF5916 domain-containing protein [uncultured Draconibacterium sp.]
MKNHFLWIFLLLLHLQSIGQSTKKPVIAFTFSEETIRVDGLLNEAGWQQSDSITTLGMVEPIENGAPTYNTTVKVLADAKNIYVGITCFDTQPGAIVAFSKARDSELEDEDYLKIIFDTFNDGRNGYIFAINPFAARYDALVSNNGESENSNWDGPWDAKTSINTNSWSAEIRIPVSTLTYNKKLDSWGFNVERRIQRLLEVNRWSGISMDYKVGQTLHAGSLSNVPLFNSGIGLTPRVSLTGKLTQDGTESANYDLKPSLDITQRITTDITAQLTVNTDFAETEVDSRQTNLTRFPLLYPEKRQFFLEGADIFDFGISLGRSLMPFYSRRIGLYNNQEVPINWGAKVNGKVNNTYFGGLVTQTGDVNSVIPSSKMGVLRVKQNILKESSVGMITTIGDPGNRNNAWSGGIDFTYQTSTFGGNKNFLIGVWGMYANREGLDGDKSAVGFKIDYPNDLWDWFVQYRRIGDAFEPSMGFVSRNNISTYSAKVAYMPRPENRVIRQHQFRFSPSLTTDLNHNWESYELSFTPINVSLESGDNFSLNFAPSGEFLKDSFYIAEDVTIEPGAYHWSSFEFEASTASKRAVNGTAAYRCGGFYGGNLDQVELQLNWRLMSFLILEFSYENNIARIPAGDFSKELLAVRTALNINSNLNFSLFTQYDNESESVGSYSRLRWTFAPLGDLFVVYKHNIQPKITDKWRQDQNQLIVKLTYGLAL